MKTVYLRNISVRPLPISVLVGMRPETIQPQGLVRVDEARAAELVRLFPFDWQLVEPIPLDGPPKS